MSATPLRTRPTSADPVPVPPPPGNGAHHRAAIVVGTLLILGGLTWLGAELGLVDVGWQTALATVLVLVGLATGGLALTGHRTGGLVVIGVVLTLVLAVGTTVEGPLRRGGVGERLEQPTSAAQLQDRYELALGEMTLDLGTIDLPAGTTTVTASVGAGELRVRLPEAASVEVHAEVGAGESRILGETRSGLAVQHDVTADVAGSEAVLELHLSVTAGEVEVER